VLSLIIASIFMVDWANKDCHCYSSQKASYN